MEYRKLYEKIKKLEQKKEHKELTDIMQAEKSKYKSYTGHASGGLLSVGINNSDKSKKTLAFILEKHYSVPNYGIEYSVDFGVVKGKKTYRDGFNMVRGGRPNDIDDFHGWYNEVKILEEGENNVIIGLKSGNALDIREIDLGKDTSRLIKRYDLEKERIDKEKKELEEQAKKTEDFEEKLQLVGKKLRKNYAKARDPFYKIIEHKGKKLGIIAVETYDRDYDASTDYIDFYILGEKAEEPVKVLRRRPHYDQSYKYSKRFFSVRAKKEISDKIIEEDGKIKIPVKLTIGGTFDSGSPYRQHYEEKGKEEFDLVIEPKKHV